MLDRLHELAASLGYDCQRRTPNELRLQWGGSPVVMMLETSESDGPPACFWVCRNSSAHFAGDRSDINFACTMLFAGWMSSFLQTTFELREIGHPVLPDENDGYLVIPRQPQYLGVDLGTPFDSLALTLHLQHGFEHHLTDFLGYVDSDSLAEESAWSVDALDRAASPSSGFQATAQARRNPDWQFYHRTNNGLAVLQSSTICRAIDAFAGPLDLDEQLRVPGARLQRDECGKHVVPQVLLRQGERIVRTLTEASPLGEPRLMRFENALCLLQGDLVMLLPGACGRAAHDSAAAGLIQKQRAGAAYLRAPTQFKWAKPVPPDRFEALVQQLLLYEPGVNWARPVGGAFDRDAGRDLIADWSCSVRRDGSGLAVRRVIVQCKVRQRGVGKADVTDIRDTLETHKASGILVVTPNWLTSSLVDHLDDMRQQQRYWVDWWTQTELEARLRQHPDVAVRFADVVVEAEADSPSGQRPPGTEASVQ